MPITKNCLICGKETSKRNLKYCSTKCVIISQRKKVKNNCLTCGKEFSIIPYYKNKRKYCSTTCHQLDRHNKRQIITRTCLQCGKQYQKGISAMQQGKFCSKKCMDTSRRKYIKKGCLFCEKEFNYYPNCNPKKIFCSMACWRKYQYENRTLKTCLECGKVFRTTPSVINKRKFCSKRCVGNALKRRVFSEEWKKRMSEIKSGVPNPRVGAVLKKMYKEGKLKSWSKGLTKETDERIKKSIEKGRVTKLRRFKNGELTVWNKGKKGWASKEQLQKALMALMKRPTRPENKLIEIIKENNLPYEYVGNGKQYVGTKNPDFIHNTEHKILECFGLVYHSKRHSFFKITNADTKTGKINYYKKLGYETLVLWDNEILYCPKEKLLKKINDFTNSY